MSLIYQKKVQIIKCFNNLIVILYKIEIELIFLIIQTIFKDIYQEDFLITDISGI